MNLPYIYRLTVAVPESLIDAANHLAVAIGECEGDISTFRIADWQDSFGNKYAVASTQATELLFAYASSPLQRRDFAPVDWDTNLAGLAQSKVVLWFGDGDAPEANPDNITGIVFDDPHEALNMLGLTRVQ